MSHSPKVCLIATLICAAVLPARASQDEPASAHPSARLRPVYPPLRTAREQQLLLARLDIGPWRVEGVSPRNDRQLSSPAARQQLEFAVTRGGGRQQSLQTSLSPMSAGQLRSELFLYRDKFNPVPTRVWTDGGISPRSRPWTSQPGSARLAEGPAPDLFGANSATEREARLLARLLDEIAPGTARDLRILVGRTGTQEESPFAAAKTGAQAVMVGTVAADGGCALAAGASPGLAGAPVVTAVGQWAGPVGWGALAAYEGFTVWQWQAGYMTDRQFTRHQAHFVGGVAAGAAVGWAGAKAGALAGGAIGALFGPAGIPLGVGIGAAVGALGGGVLGGTAGSRVSTMGLRSVFEFHDRQREAEYLQFVRQHYGVP